MKTFSRRDFLKVTGVGSASVAAALALTACSSNNNAGNESSTANESSTTNNSGSESSAGNTTQIEDVTEAAQNVSEEESDILDAIVVGCGGFYTSLTPVRNGNYQWNVFVRYLFDRVIYRTGDRRYIGQGAKSWSVADDGVTYSVELYDNITDSEGNAVTAEDVVWMIEESMAAKQKACYAKIDHVTLTGDYTFDVVMKMDMAENFEICMASTYLVARSAYEASADQFATSSVTTSAYVVTNFVASNSCELTLRDDYWMTEEELAPELRNHVKKMTYNTITEVSQQQIALETNVVDTFMGLNATIVHAFEENDQFKIITAPAATGNILYCSGHESRAIASDVNLRHAIFACIDAEGCITAAADGRGELMHDFVPRVSTGYVPAWDDEEYFPYDPAAAEDYLSKSNYDGTPLVLLAGTSDQKLAQVIQGYCLAVGINIELAIEDQATMSTHAQDGSTWDLEINHQGNGLINVWSNRFDNTAYAMGDAMSRHDDELQQMLEFTWQVANFTDENKTKVHQYIIDQAYAYGMYLGLNVTVTRADVPMETPLIASSGEIDYAGSIYKL
ncbi:MAG: ABC transporter substrate-binding protein [Firmicutes bacterium]|nr:ABC transporter substrate-binding protein [Bacillota bacterium]